MFYFGNDRTASTGLLFVRGTFRNLPTWPPASLFAQLLPAGTRHPVAGVDGVAAAAGLWVFVCANAHWEIAGCSGTAVKERKGSNKQLEARKQEQGFFF
jgi:hypothetical protein